jgi:N-acetyltransferase
MNTTALATPLGIPRLFTSIDYRRQGVASALLTAAARTAIHGCILDPQKGEIAFTQPTESGQAVMEHWGKGGVRVYEE